MQPGAGSPDVSKVWFTIAKMPRPRFMIYDLGYPKFNSQQRYQVSFGEYFDQGIGLFADDWS